MDVPKFSISVISLLVMVKVLLVPAYSSTDLEVHRNWLAITWNKNVTDWYTESTSQWTLDYPPFFAFFQLALAWISYQTGNEEALRISEAPILNNSVLYFQRSTVIAVDLFYFVACYVYSFKNPIFRGLPRKVEGKARKSCFLLLATCQVLLIVDSIHFQYNSMLTAIFLLSMYAIDAKKLILGAFLFSVLVNFKHIYVYYALGYVAYYLLAYFELPKTQLLVVKELWKACVLASALAAPFSLSLTLFWVKGGISALESIVTRLFPVSRGLTHAFWAPNIWSLYNLLDLVVYRVASVLSPGRFNQPTYTSGLVQEYSHSVLPSISPTTSLVLVVVVSLGLLLITRRDAPLSFYVLLTSTIFFLFGYHVHEKAILLPLVAAIALTIREPQYAHLLIDLSFVSYFTVLPLIYTDDELLFKYASTAASFQLTILTMRYLTREPINRLIPKHKMVYFVSVFALDVYKSVLHKRLFGGKMPFLPLMAISAVLTVGLLHCTAQLVALSINVNSWLGEIYFKSKWERIEKRLLGTSCSIGSLQDESVIRLIAGVDISASKSSSQFAMISISVYEYPRIRHVETFVDSVIITEAYLCDYLFVREAGPIASAVNRVLTLRPDIRPDVILYDGNGTYHGRGCGAACIISAMTMIPCIGVAKTLLASPLKRTYGQATDKILHKFREELGKFGRGWISFDLILPVTMHVLKQETNKNELYVSVGCGLAQETATKVVLQSWLCSSTCEQIRQADLTSREAVRSCYD